MGKIKPIYIIGDDGINDRQIETVKETTKDIFDLIDVDEYPSVLIDKNGGGILKMVGALISEDGFAADVFGEQIDDLKLLEFFKTKLNNRYTVFLTRRYPNLNSKEHATANFNNAGRALVGVGAIIRSRPYNEGGVCIDYRSLRIHTCHELAHVFGLTYHCVNPNCTISKSYLLEHKDENMPYCDACLKNLKNCFRIK
ncbi:hypothetical protein HZA99_06145 [Candidatus Woesearchaeota archaeon]|nr:hypothetical protein [Candidatus Woesearchaeota archaeon]